MQLFRMKDSLVERIARIEHALVGEMIHSIYDRSADCMEYFRSSSQICI